MTNVTYPLRNIRDCIELMPPEYVDVVIYHDNCTDGFTAAMIAWMMHGENITFIPKGYKRTKSTDDLLTITDKNILVLDFALDGEILEELLKTNNVLILDHHHSAKDKLIPKFEEHAYFDMSRSGAYITWLYFNRIFLEDDESGEYTKLLENTGMIPLFIRYVSDIDLWNFTLPNSRELKAYLYNILPFVFYEYYKLLDQNMINLAISYGGILYNQEKMKIDHVVEKALIAEHPKFRYSIVNSPELISDIGAAIANGVDFSVVWYVVTGKTIQNPDKKSIKASIRVSNDSKFDAASFAKKMGGGGHLKSSAFIFESAEISDLIDKINELLNYL